MTDPQRLQRLHQRANEWRWAQQDLERGYNPSQTSRRVKQARKGWWVIPACVALALAFSVAIALSM